MVAESSEDLQWLSDYVVGVLRSPTWVVPVAQFVDERCVIFEDSEENHFEYTRCHEEYQQLVDSLMAIHLMEVSVSEEDFERFCQTSLMNKQLHRTLVEQLLAAEDFLIFKAMMTKQNAELTRAVIKDEDDVQDLDDVRDAAAATSMKGFADMVVGSCIDQGLDDEWQIYDAQLWNALKSSENDQEQQDAQQWIEDAELEQAIALSLQLEEERLRQLVAAEDLPEEETHPDESQLPALQPPPGSFISAPLTPLLPRIVNVDPLSPAGANLSSTLTAHSSGAWGFTSAPLCPAYLPEGAQPQEAPAPGYAEAAAAPEKGIEEEPVRLAAPSQLPEVTFTRGRKLSPGEMEELRSNLQNLRERAERAIAAPRSAAPSRAGTMNIGTMNSVALEEALAGLDIEGGDEPSDEERRKRAEHLRRLRDRLVQKRQQEREQKMEEFQRLSGAAAVDSIVVTAPDSGEARAAAGRRLVAELTPGAVKAGPSAPPLPNAEAAAERMRHALTLQLRQSLMKSFATDAGVLGEQLSQLESRKYV